MRHNRFRSYRGLGADTAVIFGLNPDGSYTVQNNDYGVGIAKKFQRPAPDTAWREMYKLNPQTHGRPGEARYGWDLRIGERLNIPPQWLADIGWTGEIKAPPGAAIVTPSGVVTGGQTIFVGGGQVGPQPAPAPAPAPAPSTGTQAASFVANYGLLIAAAVVGLAAALVLSRRGRSRRFGSRRPSSRRPRSSRPALPSRRSSR